MTQVVLLIRATVAGDPVSADKGPVQPTSHFRCVRIAIVGIDR